MSSMAPEALGGRPKRKRGEPVNYIALGGVVGQDDEDEPAAKKQRTKKPPANSKITGRPLPSDDDLHVRLRALGKLLKVSSGPITPLDPVTDHTEGWFADLEGNVPGDQDWYLNDKKRWGGFYRAVWRDMDELFSTSAVREFIRGYFDALPTDPAERANAAILFENLSKASRFPTHIIGYNTGAGSEMQHITSPGEGVFSPTYGGSAHSALDRERKLVATEAGEKAALLKNATKETVVKAMLREAAVFTLNYMAAPASASDIQPFGERTKLYAADAPENLEWTWQRELIKHLAIALGAEEEPEIAGETGRGRAERPWNRAGKNKREVSPARVRLKGDEVKLFKDPAGAIPGPLAAATHTPFPPTAAPTVPDFPPTTAADVDMTDPALDPLAQAAHATHPAPTLMDLADAVDFL